MILVPRQNRRSSFPIWQDKLRRRLALLKFVGPGFWLPKDFELVGAYGPVPANIMRSVSAFPYGSAAAAGASGGAALDIGDSFLTDISFGATAYAGFRFERDGDYATREGSSWSYAGYGDNWIESGEHAATVGDDYEAYADKTGGNSGFWLGGWVDGTTYTTINTTLTHYVQDAVGTERTSSGTVAVREIVNTSNVASQLFSLSAEFLGGGMMLIP